MKAFIFSCFVFFNLIISFAVLKEIIKDAMFMEDNFEGLKKLLAVTILCNLLLLLF